MCSLKSTTQQNPMLQSLHWNSLFPSMFLVYVFFEINNTTEPNVAEFTGEWVFHCMFLVFMSFEINITTDPNVAEFALE